MYVDAVTGEPVHYRQAGAVFAGVGVPVSRAGSPYTTWVPIPAQDVLSVETDTSYPLAERVTYSKVQDEAEAIREKQAKAKKDGKSRPTKKQDIPGLTETYRNAGDAADLFLGMNWSFIESTGYSGAEDLIRDFIGSFEVRRGRARKDGTYSHKRLNQTKKGGEILTAFSDSDEIGAREFLVWLFSRNRSKRWREVNWDAVEELGDILQTTCEENKDLSQDEEMRCSGWIWYPPAAGLRPLVERLEDLTPKAARQFENQEHTRKLNRWLKDLRAAFKRGKSCLPAQTQKVIKTRISYLAKLAKEPWRIPHLTICGPDPESGHQFCGFPAIRADVLQLRRACEFGYDPNWPMAEALSVEGAQEMGLPVGVATGESRPPDIEGTPITLEELDAIPWETEENPGGKEPPSPGTLDDDGKRMLWTVYEAAKKHYRKQGERGAGLRQLASRVAWAEVKRHYFKRGKNWQKRKHVIPKDSQALDLRQRALPLKKQTTRTSANPPKYRPIRWKVEELTTPKDRSLGHATIEHRGDGYWFRVYTGRGQKRISAIHRYRKPEAILKGTVGTFGENFPSVTAAKKAANADRRAYLKAKRKGGSKPRATSSKANPTRSRPTRNPWGDLLDLRARVVELEVGTADGRVQVHTWDKDRPALFWSEKKRALVWVHGGKDPGAFVDGETRGPVASRHRKWHGRAPSEVGTLEVPAGALHQLGPALRIVYFAERYRDGAPRHHDFGPRVGASAQDSGPARVFSVSGGRLTLNGRGLVF